MIQRQLIIRGHVQGVGFRPFVYRLAHEFGITGSVLNRSGEVEIIAQATEETLSQFQHQVIQQAPPLAKPHLHHTETRLLDATLSHFTIRHSATSAHSDIHLPPDFFACDDCLRELLDPNNRRYRYPFINCTQCGPRYTLITALPYDRPNTSMASFKLCPSCDHNYQDPLDRRFHAQPLACADCGPQLRFIAADNSETGETALAACVQALQQGKIIAVKGIGGYHLLVDACNDQAVLRLRQRKQRPHKPLAVMFPHAGNAHLDTLKRYLNPTSEQATALCSVVRPIVLTQKKADSALSTHIAPNLAEIGAFLPYSPLHELLLHDIASPLVATSGNLSGEPVITDASLAESKLANIADGFLHHNRPIVRPADDSVLRIIAHQPRRLRVGRGLAPLEIELPIPLNKPTLAVGGQMKNTIALGWGKHAVLSPHIGELNNPASLDLFARLIADWQHLYQVTAERIVHDTHPGYQATRWAQGQDLPQHSVLHHHAHAALLPLEFPEENNWLIFSWDGTGLGTDQTIWGSEVFFGTAGNWQHITHLAPFRLPGGDKASREPWRAAAALCWQAGQNWQPQQNVELAKRAWEKNLNCPPTQSMGRLFDACACLILGIEHTSFEAQAAMQLETLAAQCPALPTELGVAALSTQNGQWDWQALINICLDTHIPQAQRARYVHECLAATIATSAQQIAHLQTDFAVGLSGGVFQNRLLSELSLQQLCKAGFRAYLPEKLPFNDAGLALGQLLEIAAHEA